MLKEMSSFSLCVLRWKVAFTKLKAVPFFPGLKLLESGARHDATYFSLRHCKAKAATPRIDLKINTLLRFCFRDLCFSVSLAIANVIFQLNWKMYNVNALFSLLYCWNAPHVTLLTLVLAAGNFTMDDKWRTSWKIKMYRPTVRKSGWTGLGVTNTGFGV